MGVVIVLPRRFSLTIARANAREETIMPQLPSSHHESPVSYFTIQWRKLEVQHVQPVRAELGRRQCVVETLNEN